MDIISKGINVGVGALSGYLAQKDITESKTKFLDKNANRLAIAAALGGTAIEMWMPNYAKYAAPISASGFTLLGRSLYFETQVKDDVRTPGISEVVVPRARGRARNYSPDFQGVEVF